MALGRGYRMRPMTLGKRTPYGRYAARTISLVLLLWLGGFIRFAIDLPRPIAEADLPPAQAGVVLTGGAGRIGAGLNLLEASKVERLLISGVNLDVDQQSLEAAFGGEARRDLFDCCVDVGRVALDTRGNAAEAADWVQQRELSSLVVVTARYHMPRAMLEFEALMADVELTAFPVAANAGVSLLMREYNKYLLRLINRRFGA